jgi:vacuolar protein sorting-associated protein 72
MPTDDEDTHDATSPAHSEDNVKDNINASSSQSASGSGSDNSDSDNSEDEVEWLVTSRAKRATAGNRLNALLQQEEEKEGDEDELELLFAEADDDAGFESDAAADSDVQMDSSSSDDEDAGADNDDDNLAGERELRRAERAEKQAAKKRKATDGIPAIFKKRVKIDPTAVVQRKPSSLHPGRVAPTAAAPRPKKKSERASWIPTQEDAPTRASARGTTRASKETLHAQMIDREVKRLRQLANMEKAAAAKEAAKKPAMTQADRLAEAARVEKSNAKSLSRWEEAEQAREEEQRAKLAALSNRQLEGPVITWWSGLGEWTGGVLRKVGKNLKVDEPKEKGTKKRKAAEMEGEKNDGEKAEGGKPHEEKPEGQKVEGENPEGEVQQTAGGTEGETTKKTGDSEMTADGPEKARQTEEKTADVPENAAQTEQRTMDVTENAPQTEEKSDESTEEAPQQPSTDTQLLNDTDPAGKPEDTGKSDQESVCKPPGAELQNPESSPEESETATNQEGEGKEEEGNQGAGKEQEKPASENPSAEESKPEAETEPAPSPPKPQSESAPGPKDPSPQPPSDTPAPPQAPAPSQTPSNPPFILAPPPGFPPAPATLDGSTPLPGLGFTPTIPPTGPLAHAAPSQLNQQKQDGQQSGQENQQSGPENQPQENQQENQQQPPDGPPAPPPVTEKGTVNLLILANFDEFAIKNKDVQTQVLFNRKFPKAPSKFFSLIFKGLPPHRITKLTPSFPRTQARASPVRHNLLPGTLPRPRHGSGILQLLRLPRDPASPARRVPLEQTSRRVRWAGNVCGAGRAGEVPYRRKCG